MRKNRTAEPETEDQRPPAKPRKHPQLWQAFLMWDELVEMRKRHELRLTSIERGKSNMDATMEEAFLEATALDTLVNSYKRQMVSFGTTVGPVWDWMTSIKGLGEGGMAAQLLAQVDDITSFTNVSKLWRFCGQAVIDGASERGSKGEKSHYSRRLKALCYLIGDQFIRQQTSGYIEIYYAEKARLRELHPEPEANDGNGPWKQKWTPAHINAMARRKMVKIFLQHLWLTWRQSEGLPTNEPYAIAHLGHADMIAPFEA